jgi:hypothetical protein
VGYNIAQRTESFTNENLSWLGSAHGTEMGESITLDADLFLDTFEDGVVPSGVTLGLITETGLYGPYDADADDGREVMVGHLFTTTDLKGTTEADARDTVAALLRHCQVVEANLPVGHGLDAGGKADVAGRIDYV